MEINERDKYIMLYEKYSNFLSQSQKQCFHLSFIEDLSLSEISEIVATTRQAVKDSVDKAKLKLIKIDGKMSQ